MTPRHPMQPLGKDRHGVLRFRKNKIVDDLLDHASKHGLDLNEIAVRDYERADRVQFAQLIGYSLCGFGELPYITTADYAAAELMAETGRTEQEARIEALEAQLSAAREALREGMAVLFDKHPDDLGGGA